MNREDAMELVLKDKVVLVTGASRGIGAASAKALAHHGAVVIVNYVQNQDQAETVLKAIEEKGGRGIIFQTDVRDPVAVEGMVDTAIDQFGKIDILVNNANIHFPMETN
jgi:3-oxoacyl-[acyl-carrier protein] reductase